MSQAALAARSGVSRITIARLEAGSAQDVRAGTLVRLCEALGLELAVEPVGAVPAFETLLAREQASAAAGWNGAWAMPGSQRGCSRSTRRGRALSSPGPARSSIAGSERACAAVTTSRAGGRCCAGPRERVAQALLEPGDWADALFQNTPWGFALPPLAA